MDRKERKHERETERERDGVRKSESVHSRDNEVIQMHRLQKYALVVCVICFSDEWQATKQDQLKLKEETSGLY